jgi:hypothetical protein
MRGLVIGVALLLLACLQVSAVPYFMLSAAQADILLVTLALLLVFQGPRVAMVSLPMIAVFLGFLSDRSPATLILAFLPLLPLAYWLDQSGTPVPRYVQTVFAVGTTGLWARLLLSATNYTQGAQVELGSLFFNILLPGLVLDLALLSLAYLALHLLGWEPRSLSPARERYRA